VFGAVVQGPASPITCVTPRDTFAPAAPKQLAAIGSAGIINLIWEPNSEPDLAGYIVLRGDAPGDKLQALTPAPISATNYRDTDVKPGVRYVYAVVAVDKAEPPNVSVQSNRAEETARQ
jgi:fibronectin type 3 domain-containing protein